MRTYPKYFYLIIIAAAAVFQIFFFFTADIRLILDLTPDDAAYYFKIAENFNRGYVFSFDGIHQTNGFQPLWQYLLIILYFIFPKTPETFFRVALVFQVFLLSGAAVILFRHTRKKDDEKGAFISLAVFLILVFVQAMNGMESALLVLVLVVLYGRVASSGETIKDYFILGILTGVLLLSRLDFIFLPLIWFSLLLIRKGWKIFISAVSGVLLIFLPYALNNYFHTGHIQPVSGVLKSSFPEIIFNIDLQFTITGLFTIFISLVAAVIFIIKNFIHFPKMDKEKFFIFILSLTIIIHYAFYLLFIKWPVLNYYFLFYGVFLAIIAGRYLKLNRILVTGVVSFALVFILYKGITRSGKDLDNSWHVKSYKAGIWAKENTPPDAVFAMKDAGNFAFFSERRVINLDGLVNDFYFQDVIKEKKLNEYLRKNSVSYYVLYDSDTIEEVSHGTYQNYNESFMSYKYTTTSDTLSAGRDQEVYREVFKNDRSVFLIWKIH
jgi:hypothetical protein